MATCLRRVHYTERIQTDLRLPRAARRLADLDVIASAPAGMNASGYADLLAKSAAGGDWILADAAGEEPIHQRTWNAVQGRLRAWLSAPLQLRRAIPPRSGTWFTA